MAGRLEDYLALRDFALSRGAERAVFLPASGVVMDERVRLKCQVPLCPDYNHNLRCPPNVPPVGEMRRVLGRYASGLLVQVVAAGQGPEELKAAEKKLQLLVGEVESRAMAMGYYLAAGFGGSSCRMCPECVGVRSGLPCRNPGQARPSMEALGIDVLATARGAGLPFSLQGEEVVYTGLVLIE